MKSKASIFGHPLHPILIVFPMGLLPASLITDAARAFTGDGMWSAFSFWLIVAGIAGGLLAAIFGLIDWSALPKGSRERRIGSVHAIANVIMLTVFAISAWLRWPDLAVLPPLAVALSIIAFLLAGFSGVLGGELVYRHHVGVNESRP